MSCRTVVSLLMLVLGAGSVHLLGEESPGSTTASTGTPATGTATTAALAGDPDWPPLGDAPPITEPGLAPELTFWKAVVARSSTSSVFSLDDPTAVNRLTGGRRGRHQGVTLEVDEVVLRRTIVPGATATAASTTILAELELKPGPNGPADGRVHLDSRQALDPRIAFRGRLFPRSMRLALVPEQSISAVAVYRLDLAELGPFAGWVTDERGSYYLQGWGGHGSALLEADVTPGSATGLGAMRLRELTITCRDDGPAQVWHPAVLQQIRDGLTPPTDDRRLTMAEIAGSWQGSACTIRFTRDGKVAAFVRTDDEQMLGDFSRLLRR